MCGSDTYVLLATVQLADGSTERLLKLRNPWGTVGYKPVKAALVGAMNFIEAKTDWDLDRDGDIGVSGDGCVRDTNQAPLRRQRLLASVYGPCTCVLVCVNLATVLPVLTIQQFLGYCL